jgi:hypothetical protein
MKRLHTGMILFDGIEIFCLSFIAGVSVNLLFKYAKKKRYLNVSRKKLKLFDDVEEVK